MVEGSYLRKHIAEFELKYRKWITEQLRVQSMTDCSIQCPLMRKPVLYLAIMEHVFVFLCAFCGDLKGFFCVLFYLTPV